MTPKNILLIPKIERGIVIDHIPAGLGIQVMALIGRWPELEDAVITLGLNYKSTRMGRKDMIKLQASRCRRGCCRCWPGVSGVTIKRIDRFEVVEKVVVQVPELFDNLRLHHPNCITNANRTWRRASAGSNPARGISSARIASASARSDELAGHLQAGTRSPSRSRALRIESRWCWRRGCWARRRPRCARGAGGRGAVTTKSCKPRGAGGPSGAVLLPWPGG
jgi:aspartate carbamoyltransferase regulatory subunit